MSKKNKLDLADDGSGANKLHTYRKLAQAENITLLKVKNNELIHSEEVTNELTPDKQPMDLKIF